MSELWPVGLLYIQTCIPCEKLVSSLYVIELPKTREKVNILSEVLEAWKCSMFLSVKENRLVTIIKCNITIHSERSWELVL